jgi:hypothetical protein
MLEKLNDNLNNIGDEVYRTWSDEQQREEIGKLVQGFKNGLPVQILCQLATSIAGTPEQASEHIAAFLSRKERKAIVKNESGSNQQLRTLLESTLLARG